MFSRKKAPKLLGMTAAFLAVIILLSAPAIAMADAADNIPLSRHPLLTMPLGIIFVLAALILTVQGVRSVKSQRRRKRYNSFHGSLYSTAGRSAAQIRSEFKSRLPSFMQPFLTWLMGRPYSGQKPLVPVKHWSLTVLTFMAIWASGIASACWAINAGGVSLFVLPVSLLLTVCGARALQVHICHQAIHKNLSGKWLVVRSRDKKTISLLDFIIAEVISTMIVVQDATAYEHDHDGVHHPDLASGHDPDFKFIVEVMNLKPWLSKEENRKRFFNALFSPKIHGLFLLGRLYANYVGSPLYRRLMSVGWLLIVVSAVALSGMWLEFGFVVFCMTVPYSMSAMAQFFTEHFWTEKRKPGQSARQHHDNKLLNRYLCDPLPSASVWTVGGAASWARWWARLFFVHVPLRLGVLPADLPSHGGHHCAPMHKGWTDSIYTFHCLAEETGRGPREIAGSFGVILDQMLEAFSHSCPPSTEDTPTMTTAEAMKIVGGM